MVLDWRGIGLPVDTTGDGGGTEVALRTDHADSILPKLSNALRVGVRAGGVSGRRTLQTEGSWAGPGGGQSQG